MKRLISKFTLLLLLTAGTSAAFARITLPSMLSSNMVLQQKSQAKLWGTAKPSSKVKVSPTWDKKTYTASADAAGNWEISLQTPSAGGPFQITLDDGEKLILENVLIGEVWLCSGQSNMVMRVKGGMNQPISNYHDIVLSANNEQIRVFTAQNETSPVPAEDVKGSWKTSNTANVPDFSAIAFVYAQQVQKMLGVPVGMIVTAWGGTPVKSWMPEASVRKFPAIPLTLSEKANPKDARVLYNKMIHPFRKYAVKGFLWYQGEADRIEPDHYADHMKELVSSWRQVWESGNSSDRNLPFYFVQIAPWLYPGDKETAGALLREQQLIASRAIPNAGMAVTMDLGSDLTIHPPRKIEVAQRLAYLAFENTYGIKGIASASPELKEMTLSGNTATLTFTNSELGLYFANKKSPNFEIAGADKVFHPAEATITNKGIVVKSDRVKTPVAVRYGFKNYVEGDLYNTFGLPASSFRTDNW